MHVFCSDKVVKLQFAYLQDPSMKLKVFSGFVVLDFDVVSRGMISLFFWMNYDKVLFA